ncbi:MAG: hypothetical protein HDP34_05985 [Clostridia bacterium]|nr:hypothetical protein [Clostridia bacterium]
MEFFIFMVCLFSGVISGVVYDVFYIARCFLCGTNKQEYTVKDKIFIFAADLIYCLVFAAGFVFTSVMFDFSSLRLYMLLGCVLGAVIYLKSFHIIVAFFVNRVYNKLQETKEKRNERAKTQPHRSRNHGKRNTLNSRSRRRNHIPAGVYVDSVVQKETD